MLHFVLFIILISWIIVSNVCRIIENISIKIISVGYMRIIKYVAKREMGKLCIKNRFVSS